MEDVLLDYAGFDAIDTISPDWCAIYILCRGATVYTHNTSYNNKNGKDMTINVDSGKIDKECELNRSYVCCGCEHYYDENDTVCKRGCINYPIKS